jgi:homoserine O-acetyltransferase
VIVSTARAQGPLPPLRVASLGDCHLRSGKVIPSCRIAYREYGSLNGSRTNAVLVTTWLLGRSDDWADLVGGNALVDTTRDHVIVVDALGDGYSSSPSNTIGGAAAFEDLTVGDMVDSAYRLLTERLGIRHLRAVLGFSMGGMQAVEWAVHYPDFVERIVSIAGSARVGAFDRLMWTAMLDEIEDGLRARLPADSIWSRLAHLEMLFVRTPTSVNANGVDSVDREIAANAKQYRDNWKLEDYAAQLGAIRRYDVRRAGTDDMRRAAAAMHGRMLAVYSWDDHMVTAGSIAEFARMAHADTLSIRSTCGHVMTFCERARVGAAIRAFIAQ